MKEMSFAELFSFGLSFFDSYFIRWQQVLRPFLMASVLCVWLSAFFGLFVIVSTYSVINLLRSWERLLTFLCLGLESEL